MIKVKLYFCNVCRGTPFLQGGGRKGIIELFPLIWCYGLTFSDLDADLVLGENCMMSPSFGVDSMLDSFGKFEESGDIGLLCSCT